MIGPQKLIAAPPVSAPPKWSAKLPLSIGFIGVVLLVAGFGTWSVTTTISGAIIAPGQIVVEQSRQIVQHPDGGVVGEIFAKEGDIVAAGDVLLRLDDTALKSELAVIESQFFELVARRGRLEAERDNADDITFSPALLERVTVDPEIRKLMDGQRRLFVARRETLEKEAAQLGERKVQIAAQIDGLDAQQEALNVQLALINEELEDQNKLLAKGLAQASRVLALKREKARLRGTIGELSASKAESAGRMIETDIGILRLSTIRREDAITRLRDLQFREFELSERRILTKETMSRLDVRAPASGAVFGLQVHAIRAVLRPAEPVMYIVPQDRPLVISSRVDPIHIDKIFVGQEVTLRFSAFDQRTTPEMFGTVVKISADSFVDEARGIAYYQARIVLNQSEYSKLKDLELLPGMPVQAYIRTADRTPMNYLIKPLADYFNKSFRES